MKMFNVLTQFISVLIITAAISFDEFSNELSKEMVEDGKNQYQLLQERGKLPKYGECWTSAVDQINEGCRYLTEDVQSDIALRLTNCFLEMSGHEVYNCYFDRKPNLRRICISSMSDRAFNVYTEFYTHAQNICWFLRGQVWQEKITKSAYEVSEQLKNSVGQQEQLLKQQQKSLTMQEELLNYGKHLEKILNESKIRAESIMDDIKSSAVQHKQLLSLIANSLSGLQSWLIGEISWFDSLVFYIGGAIVIVVMTSTSRTSSARLPLLFTLSMNIAIERIICDKLNRNELEIHLVHQDLYKYIWWSRHFTIIISILILITQIYFYRDFTAVNNSLLVKIQEQNIAIKLELEKIQSTNNKKIDDKFDIIRESPISISRRSMETEIIKPVINYYKSTNSDTISEISKNSYSTSNSFNENQHYNSRFICKRSSVSTSRETIDCSNDKIDTSSNIHRYNLRNRADTPLLNSNYSK